MKLPYLNRENLFTALTLVNKSIKLLGMNMLVKSTDFSFKPLNLTIKN